MTDREETSEASLPVYAFHLLWGADDAITIAWNEWHKPDDETLPTEWDDDAAPEECIAVVRLSDAQSQLNSMRAERDKWYQEAAAQAASAIAAHDELAALKAVAPAAGGVVGWQQIETAPRDGTELLLWREDCGQFIGSYTSGDNFPLTQDEIDMMAEEVLFAKDWFTQWPDARRLEGSEVPTHWMPLPPAPQAAQKEGE